ncbi:hypothetical protein LTR28_010800 [Elasticomyces elasticus]|nr:hypothetical protein LTR28_010800 [Elasticomyces elasticus]
MEQYPTQFRHYRGLVRVDIDALGLSLTAPRTVRYRSVMSTDFGKSSRWRAADDLPEPDSVKISEDYLNEQPFSDGEIFRRIRHYHQSGDDRLEKK